jgi:hypothetical protein
LLGSAAGIGTGAHRVDEFGRDAAGRIREEVGLLFTRYIACPGSSTCQTGSRL